MNNRMSPFVRFPEHELDSGPEQFRSRGLVPMGQVMDGDIDPFRGDMPTPAITPQQQYDRGQPGKKILGMPKDQFIALMGTIAQAFGGDSASGRMGAGLVNMAGMLREERLGRAKAQADEAAAKRKAAAGTAKEKREAAAKERERLEKKKGKAPTVRTFRVKNEEGVDMDVQHSFNYDTRKWEPIPGMTGKEIKEAKEGKESPIVRTFRVKNEEGVDMDVQHAWDTDAGKWTLIPGMPGKKVKPPAGEKPKEKSWAEKRPARKRKEVLKLLYLILRI